MVERKKLNHEVGSVYIPRDRRRKKHINFAEENFDETFMQGVIGSFIGSMVIFGVLFTIILVL